MTFGDVLMIGVTSSTTALIGLSVVGSLSDIRKDIKRIKETDKEKKTGVKI